MRSTFDIEHLLDELSSRPASELEGQDLDFKEWRARSVADSVDMLVEMAVCLANGGGGTVVLGVNDKAVGRSPAITGVPSEIDSNQLKRAVYERTDPKLPVIFEEMVVPEGTGRILVMQVFAGSPPYTDSSGAGKIRVGTDCQPLTGTVRRHLTSGTTDEDFTAGEIPGDPASHISASAMERLRESALRERAPDELLGLSDLDLLAALGVVRNGRLSRAGLLLAGKANSLEEHIQRYVWTHLRMQSDTHYSDRIDGHDAIPTALYRILDRIMADNPIATVEHGLFHHEYRTYPEIALREALMNAFCHADFRIASPILVKQYSGRLEINNPGGLIGGISPENILHHRPVARNPLLVEALTRLRLINRSNLGISRMYSAMLVEGKEAPLIQSQKLFGIRSYGSLRAKKEESAK